MCRPTFADILATLTRLRAKLGGHTPPLGHYQLQSSQRAQHEQAQAQAAITAGVQSGPLGTASQEQQQKVQGAMNTMNAMDTMHAMNNLKQHRQHEWHLHAAAMNAVTMHMHMHQYNQCSVMQRHVMIRNECPAADCPCHTCAIDENGTALSLCASR